MARGSISNHTATDGRVTWRVRVETTGPDGQRRQPQQTFPTRRAAEKGLRDWLNALAPPDEPPARESRSRRMVHRPTIYFLLDATGHAIKIGRSTDVPGRLRSLRTACAEPPRLLGLMPGDSATEALVQRQFAALRLSGEWFRAEQPLVDYIRAHALSPAEHYQHHDYRSADHVAAYVARHADVLADLAALPVAVDAPDVSTSRGAPQAMTESTTPLRPHAEAAERAAIERRLAAWQEQHPAVGALRLGACADVLGVTRAGLGAILAAGHLHSFSLGPRTTRIAVARLQDYLTHTYGDVVAGRGLS